MKTQRLEFDGLEYDGHSHYCVSLAMYDFALVL